MSPRAALVGGGGTGPAAGAPTPAARQNLPPAAPEVRLEFPRFGITGREGDLRLTEMSRKAQMEPGLLLHDRRPSAPASPGGQPFLLIRAAAEATASKIF